MILWLLPIDPSFFMLDGTIFKLIFLGAISFIIGITPVWILLKNDEKLKYNKVIKNTIYIISIIYIIALFFFIFIISLNVLELNHLQLQNQLPFALSSNTIDTSSYMASIIFSTNGMIITIIITYLVAITLFLISKLKKYKDK